MSRGLDVESSFYLRVIDPNYLYSSHPYSKNRRSLFAAATPGNGNPSYHFCRFDFYHYRQSRTWKECFICYNCNHLIYFKFPCRPVYCSYNITAYVSLFNNSRCKDIRVELSIMGQKVQCSLSSKINARQTVSLHLKRWDNCEKM